MNVTIKPSALSGIIQAPASKSSMQRACAAALVAKGTSIIRNPGSSNDDKAALEIIQRLGATLTPDMDDWRVDSGGVAPVEEELNCGESGLSIRMFTPVAALSDRPVRITGTGSLETRPMDFFDDVLPQLGVQISSNNGRLPLRIQGPLKPADVEVDGSMSSQFLTGLLLAYSSAIRQEAEGASYTITVRDLKSRPYIDLTLEVMKQFGLPVPVNNNYKTFRFTAGAEPEKVPAVKKYTVEGDWSGGAFLLVAGAIAGPITVAGLDLNSTQADKAILEALMKANAGVSMDTKGIHMRPTNMTGFEFDATDCPDLFPPLVALAAYCKGKSRIRGVSRLAHKESDRGVTLQDEFDKMGVLIELKGDYMNIHGTGVVKGADVHSNHDHRIAMACAVAALRATDEMMIEEAQAVNKSYPAFYRDLEKMGADVAADNKIKLL